MQFRLRLNFYEKFFESKQDLEQDPVNLWKYKLLANSSGYRASPLCKLSVGLDIVASQEMKKNLKLIMLLLPEVRGGVCV